VVDSRESKEGEAIRRRRQCLECNRRFTSYERIDAIPYMVVKKDGRRERFEREKVLSGLLRASERRPVSMIQLEAIADKAELLAQDSSEREVSAGKLGETIMTELKKLDKVAYVRFASVYMDFKDVQEFMTELKDLLKNRD
jgi:transcriptional repressor NrdR